MPMALSPLDWLFGYLTIGLLIGLLFAVQELLNYRKALATFKDPSKPVPLWLDRALPERPSRGDYFVNLVWSVIWLPIITFALAELIRDEWIRWRRAALLASPEYKAKLENDYREMLEKEISPWVSTDWITRRNVPWEEFAKNFEDSKTGLPFDRDAFELLWQRISKDDEICYFSTFGTTPPVRFALAGWAVLRNGKVIGQLITAQS